MIATLRRPLDCISNVLKSTDFVDQNLPSFRFWLDHDDIRAAVVKT